MGTSDRVDGLACLDVGFERDLEGFEAALRAAAADPRVDPRVDPERIYLFALDTAYYWAPLLARHLGIAGIVTWGGGQGSWAEMMMRAMVARGSSRDEPLDADHGGLSVGHFLSEVIHGDRSPRDYANAFPTRAGELRRAGLSLEWPIGRSVAFHRQALRASSESAWKEFAAQRIRSRRQAERPSSFGCQPRT